MTQVKQRKGWRMSFRRFTASQHLPTSPGQPPTAQSPTLILQPFRHFTYVRTHSPTLQSLYLRHRSFYNLSVASPTSHLILQPFFRFYYVTSSSLTVRKQGRICAVASRCFPYPTLSLASEQTLKDQRRSQGHNVEVRRVDLSSWALRTSPKFTTGVKYQFQQGF